MHLVQGKPRIGLMVERQLGETVAFEVAPSTVDLGGGAELSQVRVGVTALARAADRSAKRPAGRITAVRNVAIPASCSGMRAAQRIAGPPCMVERGGVNFGKTIGRMAARAALFSIQHGG